MVIRTRKEIPLYEKFGLFTEAPKKKKKRVINVRSPRTRDYAALVMGDDIALNNISPDEEPLSGEIGELDFTDNGEQDGPVSQERDLEGELDNELNSLQQLGNAYNATNDGSRSGEGRTIDDGDPEGADVQSGTEFNAPNTISTGTDSATVGDTESGTGGIQTGDSSENGSEQGDSGNGGSIGSGGISAEYPDNEGIPEESDSTRGDNTSGDAGGDQSVQASTEPASADGDDGDGGSSDTAGENPTDSNGSGDVDETIEIELPSEDDDYLSDDDFMENEPDVIDPTNQSTTENITDDPTSTDSTVDPKPAGTDPNSDPTVNVDAEAIPNAETIDVQDPAADPNAQEDPAMDPSATDSTTADPNDPSTGVNADLEEFDKNDMRKFQLFKRFIDLHDVSVHFISVLDAIISDDADYGAIISNVTTKLKRVEGILKDYMILKFQSDSYLQNSFFFEKAKTTILLAIEMLKRGKKRNGTAKH